MPNKTFQLDVVSVRLVKEAPILSEEKINSPETAIHVLGHLLCEMDREVVCVINLKSNMIPINCNIASIGAINQAIAEPRELLKTAILSNAANMILLHCHPSGDPQPSKDDIRITDRMMKLCSLIGVPLQDHIIVGGDNRDYFSFRQNGLMNNQTR